MARIKPRSIFVIAAIISCFAIFLYFSSKVILLQSFALIEEKFILENTQRALNAIDDDISQLNTVTSDYSGWDEAYQFIKDGNAAFIKTNLDDAIFPKLRLNFLAYVKDSGEVVFAKAYDLKTKKDVPVPANLLHRLTARSRLVHHSTAESVLSGIQLLPEGPLLIVSRPVLTSAYKGPVRGALIMGRFLDGDETRRLTEITRLSLAPFRADDSRLPKDVQAIRRFLSGTSPIKVAQQNHQTISGYGLLNDIDGNPALIVRVEMRRLIYGQGIKTVGYFIAWIIVGCLVSALVASVLYRKIILSRKEQKETEKLYRAVISQASDSIILVGIEDYRILEANAAFQQLLDYSFDEIETLCLYDIMAEDQAGVDWHIKRILDKNFCYLGELAFRSKNGIDVPVELNTNLINLDDRQMICMVVRDITERKQHEDELTFMANHDALTGLPNRTLFLDRLSQALFKKERSEKKLAVLFIDLDQFKVVNDTLGHLMGDILLKEVACRLQGIVRKADTVSRLGGDEFTLILDDISLPEDSVIVARKVLSAFALPFKLDAHEIYVSASIGITLYPTDSDTAEGLLKNADTAMYHAKERGRNNYQFFSEELNSKVCERLALETGLRRALERGEFLLHYQPRIDTVRRNIVGVEALIRWQHPDSGLVAPARFIPLAEETGLIVPIGEWVLRTACTQIKALQELGLPPIKVSVNISVRQFCQNNLVGVIRTILEETGLDPEFLELEITESVIMVNPEEAITTLGELKMMGLSIAIDDFGTGYSSLMHLKRLPVDVLKVDHNFTQGIAINKSDETLVSTIINMGHSLGLNVVAEGVETEEQMLFLGERSCEELQGFYFSKPLPSASLRELLERWQSIEVAESPDEREAA